MRKKENDKLLAYSCSEVMQEVRVFLVWKTSDNIIMSVLFDQASYNTREQMKPNVEVIEWNSYTELAKEYTWTPLMIMGIQSKALKKEVLKYNKPKEKL